MTTRRPPDLEYKGAALAAGPETGAPAGKRTLVDTRAATVELIAAVTGVPDDVGDVIEPGAFEATCAAAPRR